jgi:hypothetical protein
MSDRRDAVLLAVALALAGCAGSSAERPHVQGFTADDLLAAGDFDNAARLYQREIAESGATPELSEKLANASVRAAAAHANAALRALDTGDVELAAVEVSRAESFSRGLPVVRDARAKVDARVAANSDAARLRAQAKSVMAADPAEAARLLEAADAAAPGAGDVTRLRRDATLRSEAERSVERAESAWKAGDRPRTIRELSSARVAGRPVASAEALRRRIEQELVAASSSGDEAALRSSLAFAQAALLDESVVALLRDRLVDRLLASARDLAGTNRPAVAALLEIEAKRLRPDAKTPSLDRLSLATTTTVLVRAFEDGTGGKVDGVRLARALRERINLDAAGGGAPLVAFDDSDAARAEHPEALVLAGRVLDARNVVARLGQEDKKVRFRAGSRRVPNPAVETMPSRLEAAAAAARDARRAQEAAAEVVRTVETASRAPAEAGKRAPEAELKTVLESAKARAAEADARLKSAVEAEAALKEESKTMPREIDEPVWVERVVPVDMKSRIAQLSAQVTLSLGASAVFSQEINAAAEHKETVSAGLAQGGVPVDPDETPDDDAMAAKAADRFASLASGCVRAAADAGPRRKFEAAQAAERAGRRDEAAEGYATYLLSTADVVSPERADAARALGELLGVHVVLRTTAKRDAP